MKMMNNGTKGKRKMDIFVTVTTKHVRKSWACDFPDDDDCFYYHSWRNNVVSMVVQSARIACFRGNLILFPSSGGCKHFKHNMIANRCRST